MSTTSTVDLTSTFVKLVDTTVTAFTVQNIGNESVVIVFTDATTAPLAGSEGIVLDYHQGVDRNHGSGHVWARAGKNQTRVTVVA